MAAKPATPYSRRQRIYRAIEKDRESRVMCFVTGDRKNMETRLATDSVRLFASRFDGIFPTKKISLNLYTRGGNILAAWSLINMLRVFCEELDRRESQAVTVARHSPAL